MGVGDAGADGVADGGDGASAADGKPEEAKTGVALTEGMRKAIEAGLAGEPDAVGSKPAGQSAVNADAKPATAKGDAAQDSDKKPTKADDFQLTQEDRRSLSPRAIGRFHELHKHAKAQEAEVERLTTEFTREREAGQAIREVIKEGMFEPDDLTQLAYFNRLVKTGDHRAALAMVDQYRTALLQYLGEEAPGHDPLQAHADLKQQVDDGDMTRAAALEVAKARAQTSRIEQESRSRREAEQTSQQVARAREEGLAAIEVWNKQRAADDPLYNAKADILMPKLEGIIKRFQPHQWVEALQMAYDLVVVPNAGGGTAGRQPAGNGRSSVPRDDATLRPRGARPGAAAPGSMQEAIARGLGHSQ